MTVRSRLLLAVPVAAGMILGWFSVCRHPPHGRQGPSLSSDSSNKPPSPSLTNMWELLALLVNLMEQRGLITRGQVVDMIDELQRPHPLPTPLPRQPVPEPYLPPESEEALEARILELFRAVELTPERVRALLYRTRATT